MPLGGYVYKGFVDEDDRVHAVKADQATACGKYADLETPDEVDCPECLEALIRDASQLAGRQLSD